MPIEGLYCIVWWQHHFFTTTRDFMTVEGERESLLKFCQLFWYLTTSDRTTSLQTFIWFWFGFWKKKPVLDHKLIKLNVPKVQNFFFLLIKFMYFPPSPIHLFQQTIPKPVKQHIYMTKHTQLLIVYFVWWNVVWKQFILILDKIFRWWIHKLFIFISRRRFLF